MTTRKRGFAASDKIEAQSLERDGARGILIASSDGYDAARILIPELREFIAENIGSPFFFAIPNRDFLICWTGANSELDKFVREQVRDDYGSMPYPLSPRIYRVSAENEISQAD